MKIFLLTLSIAFVLVLAGCSDTADLGDNANGNNENANNGNSGGNVDNLRSFVLNNCNAVTDGEAADISGGQFPDDDTTDPTKSVYTQNCLGSSN